jgi:hypothetical protein
MGTFYAGARVKVEGEAPSGSAVLVVIRGPDEAEFFNRKERVGPVWLSVDKVHITRVPSVFIRLGSGDVDSMLDEASVETYQLDESAVERRMRVRSQCQCRVLAAAGSGSSFTCTTGVEPDGPLLERIRASYLVLKRQEGTYQVLPDAVELTPTSEGGTRYTTGVGWPRRARPGDYRVEVFACRDGAVVGQASTVLPVVKAGLPAQIGAFAFSHPTAYGALAVLAAAMTGLAMDALVRRRRPYRVGRGPRMPPSPTPPAAAAPETDEEAVGVGEAASSRRG